MKIYRVLYEIDAASKHPTYLLKDRFFEAEDEYVALRKFKQTNTLPATEIMVWSVVEVDNLPEGRKLTQ